MKRSQLASDLPATAPKGCTHLRLRQLSRQVSQHYDAHLAAAGLRTTQYSLLSAVMALGPARPVDLAATMKMDPSTLTRNLKPLISAGWVEMAPGADGRTRAVSITDAGRAKRAEAQRRWKVAQLGLNQTLGMPRVAALHALLDESLALLATAEFAASDE